MADDSALNMAFVKASLAPIYNASRRWDYAEEILILQLIREPSWKQEVESVVSHWNTLSSHGKHLFPHSMRRLLEDWCSVLDRIAVAKRQAETPPEPKASDKILWSQELKRLEKRMASIKSSYDGHVTWDEHNREEFAALKERKAQLIKLLGFRV